MEHAMTTIAELRKMLEAATRELWVYMDTDAFFGEIRTVDTFTLIAETPDGDDRTPDFELIVALRNFAPALLDALEAAEELRQAAKELERLGLVENAKHADLDKDTDEFRSLKEWYSALAKYDNATKGLQKRA